MFYATCTKNEGGIIRKANKYCYSVFGYTKEEIEGLQINSITPDCMHTFHDVFLRNWFTSGEDTYFGKQRKLFGRNKRGFLVPIVHMISTCE